MNIHLKTLFLFIFIVLNFNPIQSQDKDIVISILTCSPGEELYSIYGHNALRIQNHQAGTDLVYNYGTFDFDTPGFTMKFMRGQLPYLLSVDRFDDFMREYQYFERSVVEQVLNIDSTAREKIITYLQINMLPENRAYKYDFFKDNCATRLRDVLDKNIEGLKWDYKEASHKTFRQIIKEYQKPMQWTDFGIDLIIGAPADQKTSLAEEMFIPDYLAQAIEKASIIKEKPIKLQLSQADVIKFDHNEKSPNWFISPHFIFSLLFLIEILLFNLISRGKKIKYIKAYDQMWVIIITLAGLLMLFMWLGTDHIPTKYNWNILWANLLIPYWYFYGQKQSLSRVLAIIILLCLILTLINAFPAFSILPQYFHPATGMISPILILKGWRIYNFEMPNKAKTNV